jgi:polyisoprenoid-binding protein YceI
MKTAEQLTKTTWAIDPAHSEILFKVKHLMISNVKGEFTNFQATIEGEEEDFTKSTITATIDAASVFTNEGNRDTHLKSGDFFDVENYPSLTFKGTSFKKGKNDHYELTGILTIKGVSKEVTFDVEYGGVMVDGYGNRKAGFSLEGNINRKDFGLNWNAALETGGVLVSDEVRISADLQFVRRSEL